jgi:hypothetical protein
MGDVFGDAKMTTALLDRPIHRRHSPETEVTASASKIAQPKPLSPQRSSPETRRTPDPQSIIKPGQFSIEILGRVATEIERLA